MGNKCDACGTTDIEVIYCAKHTEEERIRIINEYDASIHWNYNSTLQFPPSYLSKKDSGRWLKDYLKNAM